MSKMSIAATLSDGIISGFYGPNEDFLRRAWCGARCVRARDQTCVQGSREGLSSGQEPSRQASLGPRADEPVQLHFRNANPFLEPPGIRQTCQEIRVDAGGTCSAP